MKKTDFTAKAMQRTKFTITHLSETFVSFARFAVKKCFVERCKLNEPSQENWCKLRNFKR